MPRWNEAGEGVERWTVWISRYLRDRVVALASRSNRSQRAVLDDLLTLGFAHWEAATSDGTEDRSRSLREYLYEGLTTRVELTDLTDAHVQAVIDAVAGSCNAFARAVVVAERERIEKAVLKYAGELGKLVDVVHGLDPASFEALTRLADDAREPSGAPS
jgi:hypothetical protein